MKKLSSQCGAALMDYTAGIGLVAIVALAGVSTMGAKTNCSFGATSIALGAGEGLKPQWEETEKTEGSFVPEYMIDQCGISCDKKKGPVNGFYYCYEKLKKEVKEKK